MKKFLSSLLALTMILSLVIVPANAAADDISIEVTTVTAVKGGQAVTVTATAPDLTNCAELQNKDGYTADTNTVPWNWSKTSSAFDISGATSNQVSITGKSKTTAAQTLTCTYSVTYKKADADDIVVTRRANVSVNITDPQGDFANAVSIKVQGNEYKDGLKYRRIAGN